MGRSRRRGLGARELVGITALLVLALILILQKTVDRSIADQRTVTVTRLRATEAGLLDYAFDSGGIFPTTTQGLSALLNAPTSEPRSPNWRGPYVKDAGVLEDAWGNGFQYVSPGNGDPPDPYALWSFGADGREGGQGADADIYSWDRTTQIP